MKPVVHIAKNFKDAEKYDVMQQNQMTPYERQKAARELRERYFGKNLPDVRESQK